ncbi:MAG: methionyl-tRNA formyltransferase [Actinobacteria bacterium]|nr:methionyl-tRNA formyltransferase [Actinomycetota bacterium]
MTNPDRPAGRGMELRPSPVKEVAGDAGIEVRQPDKARDPELARWLDESAADVATVVAYGKILPAALLAVPPLGFVNVHFSLLPRYRGAAPVQRALMEGATETGVSIMVLTEGMDEGPVLAMESIAVGPDDTAGAVGERLADLGASLLVSALHGYADGSLVPIDQDDSAATYAPKITPEDAHIDWNAHSKQIRDRVRGCNPVPGAWTALSGRRVKVYRVAPAEGITLAAGEASGDGGLFAGTRDVPLQLLDVQMEGRRRMTGDELVRGLRLARGSRFG